MSRQLRSEREEVVLWQAAPGLTQGDLHLDVIKVKASILPNYNLK